MLELDGVSLLDASCNHDNISSLDAHVVLTHMDMHEYRSHPGYGDSVSLLERCFSTSHAQESKSQTG